jgi:hypothetical protein
VSMALSFVAAAVLTFLGFADLFITLRRVLCTFAQICAIAIALAGFLTAHQTTIEHVLPV